MRIFLRHSELNNLTLENVINAHCLGCPLPSTLGENKYLSFVQFIIIRYWVWVQMNSHASCADVVCCLCYPIIKFKVSHCKSWAKLCCISRNVSHASSPTNSSVFARKPGPAPEVVLETRIRCWLPNINPHSYPCVKDNCLFWSEFKHLNISRPTSKSGCQPRQLRWSDSGWEKDTAKEEWLVAVAGKSDTVSTSVEVHHCCCVESEEIFSRRM